jgi:hypothetical protein
LPQLDVTPSPVSFRRTEALSVEISWRFFQRRTLPAVVAVVAKSDTEDKAKADTDHESVPKEPVAKKQCSDSNVEEEDFTSLLLKLYTKAKNIEVQKRAGDKKSFLSRTGPSF